VLSLHCIKRSEVLSDARTNWPLAVANQRRYEILSFSSSFLINNRNVPVRSYGL
jgi:hypothetical protein